MSATVAGYCPACRSRSLFVGSGGYITCGLIGCPNPTAVCDALESPDIGRQLVAGANVLHVQDVREQLAKLIEHDPFDATSFGAFFDRLQIDHHNVLGRSAL